MRKCFRRERVEYTVNARNINPTQTHAALRRAQQRRHEELRTCLQMNPHPHTEFEPGLLRHGSSASVVLFPVGQTLGLFKSIYRTLHEETLPPPSRGGMGKFGTARPDVDAFTPHLSLASSMPLMEATAMLARVRQEMRDAVRQDQSGVVCSSQCGAGDATSTSGPCLHTLGAIVRQRSGDTGAEDAFYLVGPPLTSISAVQAGLGGKVREVNRMYLRGWQLGKSASPLAVSVVDFLRQKFPALEFVQICSSAFSLCDSATGDYDLAVVKKSLNSSFEHDCPKEEDQQTSAIDLLREMETVIAESEADSSWLGQPGDDGCREEVIPSFSVSDVHVAEDAKVPILRMEATDTCEEGLQKEVEIQVGLRAFEFNLRFRERILSVLFGRGLKYAVFREAMEKVRLWARCAEISGQAHGFPPGIFWSVLMLDGVLLASLESESPRLKRAHDDGRDVSIASLSSTEILDVVFRRILSPGNAHVIFNRPFILPTCPDSEGLADALRGLTAFTRPWVIEAVSRRAPLASGESCSGMNCVGGGEDRNLSTLVNRLLADGLSHAAVVVKGSALSSFSASTPAQCAIRRGIDVLRFAGDLFYEAKCSKVRPFARVSVLGHSVSIGEPKSGCSAGQKTDAIEQEVIVVGVSAPVDRDASGVSWTVLRDVVRRWGAQLIRADMMDCSHPGALCDTMVQG